jgi:hypothetical protein
MVDECSDATNDFVLFVDDEQLTLCMGPKQVRLFEKTVHLIPEGSNPAGIILVYLKRNMIKDLQIAFVLYVFNPQTISTGAFITSF